jgi:hypothetical protein
MGRKPLLIFLFLYALVFSVLKTIRFPNGWSGGHWMLDYRFGFIKRGLGGEIFGWFFEKNEHNFFLLSAGILFLLYALIFRIVLKEIFKQQYSFYRILFFLIFLLSQYIVFSAHIIGYLDNFIFLITILVISLIKQKKLLLSTFIASVSIFIHEMSFILMLPISCFAIIVSEISDEKFLLKEIFSGKIFKKLFLFLVLPFLMMIAVSVFQEMNDEVYFSKIFNYLREFPFITDRTADSVASAYTKSFSYYFSEERGHFIHRLLLSTCTIFCGVPILFSLWMIFKEFKLKKNFQLFLLLAGISFIPLLLHVVAYDTYRIWTYPLMILFLGFWILSSKFTVKKENIRKLSIPEIAFFVVTFLFVTLIPNHLFDNEVERFSLLLRVILILPIFSILYLLKKSQPN